MHVFTIEDHYPMELASCLPPSQIIDNLVKELTDCKVFRDILHMYKHYDAQTGSMIFVLIANVKSELKLRMEEKKMACIIDSICEGRREIKPQSPDEVIFEPKVSNLTEAEKAKLAETARAMSEDEIMVILENIPVELCMKRIDMELKKARAFSNAVKNTLNIVE